VKLNLFAKKLGVFDHKIGISNYLKRPFTVISISVSHINVPEDCLDDKELLRTALGLICGRLGLNCSVDVEYKRYMEWAFNDQFVFSDDDEPEKILNSLSYGKPIFTFLIQTVVSAVISDSFLEARFGRIPFLSPIKIMEKVLSRGDGLLGLLKSLFDAEFPELRLTGLDFVSSGFFLKGLVFGDVDSLNFVLDGAHRMLKMRVSASPEMQECCSFIEKAFPITSRQLITILFSRLSNKDLIMLTPYGRKFFMFKQVLTQSLLKTARLEGLPRRAAQVCYRALREIAERVLRLSLKLISSLSAKGLDPRVAQKLYLNYATMDSSGISLDFGLLSYTIAKKKPQMGRLNLFIQTSSLTKKRLRFSFPKSYKLDIHGSLRSLNANVIQTLDGIFSFYYNTILYTFFGEVTISVFDSFFGSVKERELRDLMSVSFILA